MGRYSLLLIISGALLIQIAAAEAPKKDWNKMLQDYSPRLSLATYQDIESMLSPEKKVGKCGIQFQDIQGSHQAKLTVVGETDSMEVVFFREPQEEYNAKLAWFPFPIRYEYSAYFSGRRVGYFALQEEITDKKLKSVTFYFDQARREIIGASISETEKSWLSGKTLKALDCGDVGTSRTLRDKYNKK